MRGNHYTNNKFPKTQMVWRNEHCMWVSVPKNANMTMRKLCGSASMKRATVSLDRIPGSTEVFAIIRDPRTRLLSALAECQHRTKNRVIKKATFSELLEMLLDDISIFDEHLEPQLYYLQYHTYTNILHFENLNTNIKKLNYFKYRTRIVNKYIIPDLLSKSTKPSLENMDTMLKDNESLIEQCIKKYYQTDQDIHNNPEHYINKPMQRLMPYE